MTIRNIHIAIEQRLQSVGVFAYSDISHSEIDIAINSTVDLELRKIFRDIDEKVNSNNVERNQWQLDFTRVLKQKVTITPTKIGNSYKSILPVDYLHLLQDVSTVIANCGASTKLTSVVSGKTYKVVEPFELSGIWRYADTIFTALQTTSLSFGSVVEVPVMARLNRLVKSENIQSILQSSFRKSTQKSPVSEIVGDSLIVYTPDFEIASVELTYFKKPRKADYANGITLEFEDFAISYIIDRTVERLSIVMEESQQKIVNFKQEQIE
jgi:hypothetical protein